MGRYLLPRPLFLYMYLQAQRIIQQIAVSMNRVKPHAMNFQK